MASTLLASTAIMLSSVVAILMANGGSNRSAGKIVYGDRSQLGFSIKFFAILVCFWVAFLFNVQSIRYYSHASMLINVPFKKMNDLRDHHSIHLTAEYVGWTVNRGSYFCCVVLVFLLYYLDVTLDFGWVAGASDGEDDHRNVDA
ncbi:hypothetical protein TEA_017835 [Camellia sinensis var. sinensis]|uniref:Uncharacterized protein n=1 Tax=Camellia sinensis var. sinensis TaxID=542762 RepID=A0A4S4D9Q2_CAMSN|nr:hypothetical protein TEA_017835 [Camellia sinensis var. sinensis]